MSYIPPGWTQERLMAATVDDLAALPYETLHLIPPTSVSLAEAQDVLYGARIDERTRSERQRFKLAPPSASAVTAQLNQRLLKEERARFLAEAVGQAASPPSVPSVVAVPVPKLPRDAVVQVVEEAGYDDFGFLVVQLDYSDEDAWMRWSETFDEPVDRSLAQAEGGERIADKLLISIVEDLLLDGTGFYGAVSYCEELRANDMVQPGLNTSMILVVDKKAVDSFLSPKPDQEPWVWAVDITFPFQVGDQPPQGEPPTDRYPGYFRVTAEAAVTELWPLIKTPGGVSGKDLWNPDVRIWKGV